MKSNAKLRRGTVLSAGFYINSETTVTISLRQWNLNAVYPVLAILVPQLLCVLNKGQIMSTHLLGIEYKVDTVYSVI